MSDHIPMQNKVISSLEILPNEILLHIFKYLTSNEIIYAFFYSNKRFQQLLLTQIYYFTVPTTNLSFWEGILPVIIISSQIQTLIIDNDHLTVSLDSFSNLTSIIISSPYSLLHRQLSTILNHRCFRKLHTLKINNAFRYQRSSDKNVVDDEQILFNKVFNDANELRIFEYLPSLNSLSNQNRFRLNSNIHIRSLTFNLAKFRDLLTLIQYTPNLIYLNVESTIPTKQSEDFQLTPINEIKLEEFYLKFKPEMFFETLRFLQEPAFDKLFRVIRLFSSSLRTLSLDMSGISLEGANDVPFDGNELENQLLKPMKKLQNFYFCIALRGCKDVEQILSTFQTFPWRIGIYKNGYLCTLPFPFHELKHFHHFEDVLINNDELLKKNHRLWSKVRSLELVDIGQINFKILFPLIKLNMPKLSSITFRGPVCYDSSDPRVSDDLCEEIERVKVQLDSVTTIRLESISMKPIQQIFIHSFPNLQGLILNYTKLPSQENELTLFLSKKIQRLECDEYSLAGDFAHEKDFSYLSNLKHLKLRYFEKQDIEFMNQPSLVRYFLTKLRKLETLSIYEERLYNENCSGISNLILNGLDQYEIKHEYEIKRSGDNMWFIRINSSSSF